MDTPQQPLGGTIMHMKETILRRETRLWEHTDYIAHGLYLPGGGVGAGGRDLIPLRYNTAADGSCAFNFALGRVDGGAGVGLVRFLLGMCSWKKRYTYWPRFIELSMAVISLVEL
jgi:hypothetical protein